MAILLVGDKRQGVAIGTALQRANFRPTILPYAQATDPTHRYRPDTAVVFACPRTVCSGHCLLKQLCARGQWTHVLVVTTQRTNATRADCRAAGASDLLTPPYLTWELEDRVAALVRRAAELGAPGPSGHGSGTPGPAVTGSVRPTSWTAVPAVPPPFSSGTAVPAVTGSVRPTCWTAVPAVTPPPSGTAVPAVTGSVRPTCWTSVPAVPPPFSSGTAVPAVSYSLPKTGEPPVPLTPPPASPPASNPVLRFADLTLDLLTRQATRGRRPVELTRQEFLLLEVLMLQPGQTCSRKLIYAHVWGGPRPPGEKVLKVAINRLRATIATGGEPQLIQTVHGKGYVMTEH